MTATLTRLEHLLGDRLLVPGSPGFQDAARVEFGAFDRIPAAVAQVTTTAEVAAAVRAARDHDLPVAVRAGGHSYARHALAADALVLDLRRMDAVTIDPERRLGLAEAGATAGAYSAAAAQYGLGTGFGDTPTVGIAGLTLGGGSGFLSRRDGLTVDNLLGAEVVLADGRVVTTDERHEPDLFWALRGGGGNFGVVTSLTFRLQPTPVVTGGLLILEPTPAAVAGAVEAVLAAPDGLSALVNVLVAPPMPMLPEAVHGRPVLMLVPCWSGPAEEAEAALAPLRALGEPLFDDVAARPYPELLQGPPGSGMVLHPVMRTGFVDRVDEAWAADAVGSLASAASPMAAVSLRPLGGAVARTAPDATAFAHRDRAVMVSVGAITPEETALPAASAWVERTAAALGLGAAGYVNFMSTATPDDVAAAYPGEVLARLRAVKRRYDPDNVFRANHNITP
ncbi:MAG TPA: FAD-binding oxidoreductase [Actinomycetaceae bacterium]|nr:FAD-binding oxidoreductase [Actinomycetaceae bacterium]